MNFKKGYVYPPYEMFGGVAFKNHVVLFYSELG